MDSNSCDVDHLESDVLLPPRKRLLTGLKRQNSDVNSPGSSISNGSMNEFEMRINHLFKNYISKDDMSNEEILEISRNAALDAIKLADAARTEAEEKAVRAVKAVAAAKTALEFVEAISADTDTIDAYLKKIKMNRNVPVQLNSKQKHRRDCRNDEELARDFHRSINSSGEETSKAIGCIKFSSMDGLGSVERTSLRKCQAFKTATIVEHNKVSQS